MQYFLSMCTESSVYKLPVWIFAGCWTLTTNLVQFEDKDTKKMLYPANKKEALSKNTVRLSSVSKSYFNRM